MSNDQQPQDHPGPEWLTVWETAESGVFSHIGLARTITYGDGTAYDYRTRAEAIARCRAISAAALAWEVKKRDALAAARCEREEV